MVSFFRRGKPAPSRVADGTRLYAIGDIHGRDDLLVTLLRMITDDQNGRSAANVQMIFLGDLINRGPSSKEVVSRVRALCDHNLAKYIKGNHEEIFVSAAKGDARAARTLMDLGGQETLTSYGISAEEAAQGGFDDLAKLISSRVPKEDIAFLNAGADYIEVDDYAFVHAGIVPGLPLLEQDPAQLRWIRGRFFNSAVMHERVIVHGHSISRSVQDHPNRIGIDTGAFATGRLSAVALEGDQRWFLTAEGSRDDRWARRSQDDPAAS